MSSSWEDEMSQRNKKGKLFNWVLLIGFLTVHIATRCKDIATITEEIERCIYIWTNVLFLSGMVGGISSLMVIDRFIRLLTGKTPNIVEDLREESSEDVSVAYNGMIGSSGVITVISILFLLDAYYKIRLFLYTAIGLSITFSVVMVFCCLSMYVQTKNERPSFVIAKWSNPIFLPIMIFAIQLLVTREKTVRAIYNNIYNPPNDIYLIAALIIVLCYFLAIAFCYFSNIYCLIGFYFLKKDSNKIEKTISDLQEREQKRINSLREAATYVDTRAEQVGFIRKFGLLIWYTIVHMKAYITSVYYLAVYLLAFANLKLTKRLNGLLNPDRIILNEIRFCCNMAVIELLTLDMLLFICLESDAPCLKFFELLSTVIIIPILLSWLSELKSRKG